MIIDFHTHVFPDKIASQTISHLENLASNKAYTDGTVGGLINHMKNANVDISITLPVITKPSQFDSVNKFALSINEQFKDCSPRIISFAGIHPECENIPEKMTFIKECGFLGVKIHPDYQNTFINDPAYIEIINQARKHDLIVITHAGVDDGYPGEPVKCPPELFLEVIEKTSYEKIVLGHYGAHKQWEQVLQLLAGKNVYFDTAYTLHEINEGLFKEILQKHGADKILFATDCPWRDMKKDLEIFKSYNLEKETEDKILFRNALKLLNL